MKYINVGTQRIIAKAILQTMKITVHQVTGFNRAQSHVWSQQH